MEDFDILSALDMVNDETLALADIPQKKKPAVTRWVLPAAAALLLVAGGAAFGVMMGGRGKAPAPVKEVYVPRAENEEPEGDSAASTVGCFNYNGRIYLHTVMLPLDCGLKGDKLGSISMDRKNFYRLQDWEPGRGNIDEVIYEVKGFDPSFVVCSVNPGYGLNIYMNDNDITLTSGADLFETRYHLRERLSSLTYGYDGEYNPIEDKRYFRLDRAFPEETAALLDALDASEPLLWGDPVSDTETLTFDYFNRSVTEEYLLRADIGGMLARIGLREDGLVRVYGFNEVVFRADRDAVSAVIELMKNKQGEEVDPPRSFYKNYEDLKNDPELGSAVPGRMPEGFRENGASIGYNANYSTGEVLSTREMYISFSRQSAGGNAYISMEFGRASSVVNEYGSAAKWFVPASEFTEENIRVYSENGYTDYNAYLLAGSAYIELTWSGSVTTEEILDMIASIG